MAPSNSPASSTARRRVPLWLWVVAFAASAFLAVVLIGQATSNGVPEASPTQRATEEPSTMATQEGPFVKREDGDPMAMGDVDAPVVLVEWTDTRCPFCAAFSRDTLPTIVDEYIDAGKVRLEVHDVSFFGAQSEDAAVAARAAAEQDRFFEYLDAMYAVAPENSHPDLPREKLISFAEVAGVPDIAQFTADLDSPELRAAAQKSTTDAQQLGVNSVPFFVVGDTAVAGAQPESVFRQFLDSALSEAN